METIEPSIETTGDGSQTLRHPVLQDTYHSLRGAEGESRYIFIAQGLYELLARREQLRLQNGTSVPVADGVVRILEVGFGSGLNA